MEEKPLWNKIASEEKNTFKIAGLRVTVRDPSREINHLNKVILDGKIIAEFTRSISSTSIGLPVLMIDVKICNLIQKTLSMLDEIETKIMHKDEKGDQ